MGGRKSPQLLFPVITEITWVYCPSDRDRLTAVHKFTFYFKRFKNQQTDSLLVSDVCTLWFWGCRHLKWTKREKHRRTKYASSGEVGRGAWRATGKPGWEESGRERCRAGEAFSRVGRTREWWQGNQEADRQGICKDQSGGSHVGEGVGIDKAGDVD